MRILHAIPQFPYFGGRTIVGGYSSALLEQAIAQGNAGDEVTIISHMAHESGRGKIEPNVRTVEIFGNANPGSVAHGLRFVRKATNWAYEHRNEFDIIHVHSGFADHMIATSRIKRKSKLPTVHTLYCPVPTSGGRWNLPLVKQFLLRSACRIDALAAMSQNVATSMELWGLKNIQVVQPAVDLERFNVNSGGSIRKSLGLSDENIIILFVGNAKPQKNLTRVLDAFAEVHKKQNDVRLIVTTELPQSSTKPNLQLLRQQMESLNIADFVIQLGIIDNMPALISSSDILIAPFMDSFGPSDYFVAALEAMACGVPVISSNVGGMPEIIEAPRGILVEPSNTSEIASAMLKYVEDKELRQLGGKNARAFATKPFDPNQTAATYRTIYESLLK